jgi:4-hydroxythreonine-4-phosphate dehydrogenase
VARRGARSDKIAVSGVISRKPVIGITMGDPGGIGPEIALRACCEARVRAACAPVLLGGAAFLGQAAADIGLRAAFDRPWSESPETWRVALLPETRGASARSLAGGRRRSGGRGAGASSVRVRSRTTPRQCEYFLAIDTGGTVRERHLGHPSVEGGKAAVAAVRQAIELAAEEYLDGIVTAPVSKQSLALAGYGVVGHTEILAKLTGTKRFAMMMKHGGLRVVLATTHLALAEVPGAITAAGLVEKIKLASEYLVRFGVSRRPRIAVCGLNPHAGEGGLLGSEEGTRIGPAVKAARRLGIAVEGPLPADSVFSPLIASRYHAIVAMYHDQGIIPIKMGGMDAAVNVTLGLPFLRVSPGHGTAFDIAGKGRASPEGIVAAILECAGMAKAAGRRAGRR